MKTMYYCKCLLLGVGMALALNLSSTSPAQVTLQVLGTYATGVFDEGAQEIAAYDPGSQRLFVVNADSAAIDVIDISDPTSPTKVDALDVTEIGSEPNSVSIANGLIAVAVEVDPATDPGSVAFYDAATLAHLNTVTVGPLPDMVTFTPNGQYVLVANEGEPDDDYVIDPEGSISVIDLSGGVDHATVATAGFAAFNSAVLDPSIRIFGPGASVAQDLEPEAIAVSSDSSTAWVTCQENNALATVDIASATVTGLVGLGFKDHSLPGNGLDASNRDGAINITPWPVLGMYLPDEIAAFKIQQETFLLLANEGDARDYDGFSEETRVADLSLDKKIFKPHVAKILQQDENLGRLRTTTATGDFDGDGDHDAIFSFGGRSFSIRSTSGALVYDSGNDFEQATAFALPDYFNSTDDETDFDDRSDDKGPEPEGVAVGKAFGRTLAFIGLERIGGVMIYDVSDPANPTFEDYVNNRDFEADPESPEAGDLSPEGLLFIEDDDSPNGDPLLVVANAVSGTTTVYQVKQIK